MSREDGHPWQCEECSKTAFPSKREAQTKLNWLRSRVGKFRASSAKHIPRRAYPCPVGEGWHITKTPTRTRRRPGRRPE